MSGSRLPKDQELKLMEKLSTDDEFRAHFEKSPSDALSELGVSQDDVESLDPASLKPGKLADKASIAAAHKQLASANTAEHASMIVPFMRVG